MVLTAFYGYLFAPAGSLVELRALATEHSTLVCGPNSLYVLHRLNGHSVQYANVERVLDVEDAAVSMADIRRASESMGLPLDIRRYSAEEFSQCPLPLIAHMEQSPHASRPIGHYVVVFRADETSVVFIDGTTGEVLQKPIGSFMAFWSGHALVPISESSTPFLQKLGFACAILGMFVLAARANRVLHAFFFRDTWRALVYRRSVVAIDKCSRQTSGGNVRTNDSRS